MYVFPFFLHIMAIGNVFFEFLVSFLNEYDLMSMFQCFFASFFIFCSSSLGSLFVMSMFGVDLCMLMDHLFRNALILFVIFFEKATCCCFP